MGVQQPGNLLPILFVLLMFRDLKKRRCWVGMLGVEANQDLHQQINIGNGIISEHSSALLGEVKIGNLTESSGIGVSLPQ